ncbi:OmpH family outer membrane protein [Chitinophaga horti]|uniref:OmpH family outer membrane protein n=1 Tax=Chitinophaga horti TaxID=2920382 RepID=A0ABY6IYK9_9BACT|nr:OmpH family outer membrane protein [Chitinophaga horti]UYQ92465.1 OmpH family outer membrane protein [Chitinophaga horti]
MKKYVIVALVAFSAMVSVKASAQGKIAHINASELLQLMPEAKTASEQLEQFAAGLEKDQRALVDEYTKQMQLFDSTSAKLAEAVKQAKIKEIQATQQRIQEFNAGADQKINTKKQELLKPVLDKAKKAIEEVAKEKGYGYVFDNSEGLLLVAPAADDLMATVKTKLGIK